MKDYYDLWLLSQSYAFEGDALARAIAATFRRRGTDIPVERPAGLTQAFAADSARIHQWDAFVASLTPNPGALNEVVEQLAVFLLEYAAVARALAQR